MCWAELDYACDDKDYEYLNEWRGSSCRSAQIGKQSQGVQPLHGEIRWSCAQWSVRDKERRRRKVWQATSKKKNGFNQHTGETNIFVRISVIWLTRFSASASKLSQGLTYEIWRQDLSNHFNMTITFFFWEYGCKEGSLCESERCLRVKGEEAL